ncbi:hypothetical protein L9W92_17745 [Pelotomaculum terephthalicicum JT]|nr:hypothetical protein [Pelotomaculum terephthalicicum]MCG9969844.1 hypothetical protein [Pelotomaculum terephthalicicum JT]
MRKNGLKTLFLELDATVPVGPFRIRVEAFLRCRPRKTCSRHVNQLSLLWFQLDGGIEVIKLDELV